MLEKNKNTPIDHLERAASYAGMAVMLVATLVSVTELAEREGHRVAQILQPSYAHVGQNVDHQAQGGELVQRGKEEIRHTSASYGTAMRSASIPGSL